LVGGASERLKLSPVPIHVRAEPGDYAEACLLPGDPLRAQYIAETYLDNPVQRNKERGMLGFTGEYEGRPVSVQATGMGCPSAAIVMEELVQLGVKRFLRVGPCGGLQRDLRLGGQAGCLLTVSDIVTGEEFTRISDVDLRSAVDRMTRVALVSVTQSH